MIKIKILVGSQNFGYDIEGSDKDYLEIKIPTWEDIASGVIRLDQPLVIDKDNNKKIDEHLKYRDIRLHFRYMKHAHINTMQTLFSKEYENAEDYQWCIDNRQRICRLDLWKSYKVNSGNIMEMLDKSKVTNKDIVRAYVFKSILDRLISDDEFTVYVEGSREYRLWLDTIDEHSRENEIKSIRKSVECLEDKYRKFQGRADAEMIDLINKELIRILKKSLGVIV